MAHEALRFFNLVSPWGVDRAPFSGVGVETISERMAHGKDVQVAPSPEHLVATSHCDDLSNRPTKRSRSGTLQSCFQQPRAYGPDEPYVLLSHVQRWWEVRHHAESTDTGSTVYVNSCTEQL